MEFVTMEDINEDEDEGVPVTNALPYNTVFKEGQKVLFGNLSTNIYNTTIDMGEFSNCIVTIHDVNIRNGEFRIKEDFGQWSWGWYHCTVSRKYILGKRLSPPELPNL